MKLKEKLVKEHLNRSLGMRLGTYDLENCMEKAYLAGFEKARAMALETAVSWNGIQHCASVEISNLGEEEV